MKNNNGFTLMEMIIATVILGVLALVSFAFVGKGASTYMMASSEGKMGTETWTATERIVREIQYLDAGAPSPCTKCITTPPLITMVGGTATSTTLVFNSENKTLALCPNCQDHATAITYSWTPPVAPATSSPLYRITATTPAPGVIVADEVTNFSVKRTGVGRTPRMNSIVTVTTANPAVVTWASHGLVVGNTVAFTSTGTLPTGMAAGTIYYVVTVPSADTFTFSTTLGGGAVATTVAGTGTYTAGNMTVTTITVANPAVATCGASHGLVVGDIVAFGIAPAAVLPTGVTAGQPYYVLTVPTLSSFTFSATPNGTAVVTTLAGSGTFTVLKGSFINYLTLSLTKSDGTYSMTIGDAASPNIESVYPNPRLVYTVN